MASPVLSLSPSIVSSPKSGYSLIISSVHVIDYILKYTEYILKNTLGYILENAEFYKYAFGCPECPVLASQPPFSVPLSPLPHSQPLLSVLQSLLTCRPPPWPSVSSSGGGMAQPVLSCLCPSSSRSVGFLQLKQQQPDRESSTYLKCSYAVKHRRVSLDLSEIFKILNPIC